MAANTAEIYLEKQAASSFSGQSDVFSSSSDSGYCLLKDKLLFEPTKNSGPDNNSVNDNTANDNSVSANNNDSPPVSPRDRQN